MAARGYELRAVAQSSAHRQERAEARAAAPHLWANAKKKADHDTSGAGAVRDVLATNPGHVKLVDGKVVKPRSYSVNCQRTAQAYEMRRRGYDVTAKPRPNKKVDRLNHTSDIESFWMHEDGKLGRFRHMGVGGDQLRTTSKHGSLLSAPTLAASSSSSGKRRRAHLQRRAD